ncbi:MAG: nuclear transport factor 2 family protein, partial [Pseudomonadota bacterium]
MVHFRLALAIAALVAVVLFASPAVRAADTAVRIGDAQFREYIECFNRRDYACFGKYYADDVVLSKGPKWPALHGRQAIFDFYRDVDAHGLKEHMTIHSIAIEGNTIRADLEATFEAARDWPDFGSRVVRAGDRWQLRGTLQYRVVAGRFAEIAPAPRPPAAAVADTAMPCARQCLEGFVDRYLAALIARDPARLQLRPSVRYTENGAVLQPGEGMWKTAASLADYRINVADPHTGQAGFVGTLVQTDGKALMLALRLKVEAGAISEI